MRLCSPTLRTMKVVAATVGWGTQILTLIRILIRIQIRAYIPLRIFAARTVLAINMAMVSGPTPPGTGV